MDIETMDCLLTISAAWYVELDGIGHQYRKRTNFRDHNISWVKFLWGLIFMGKSSSP